MSEDYLETLLLQKFERFPASFVLKAHYKDIRENKDHLEV